MSQFYIATRRLNLKDIEHSHHLGRSDNFIVIMCCIIVGSLRQPYRVDLNATAGIAMSLETTATNSLVEIVPQAKLLQISPISGVTHPVVAYNYSLYCKSVRQTAA